MSVSKLASHLRMQRQKKNYTIRDIERISGYEISDCNFNKLESGKIEEPSPQSLRVISRVMKIDYVNLLILAGYITKREIKLYNEQALITAIRKN